MTKTIAISEDAWKELMNIKISHNYSNIAKVVDVLIKFSGDLKQKPIENGTQ
jgi:predicted CopG family antitoxin